MDIQNKDEISFERATISPLMLTYEDSRYYRKNKPNLIIEELCINYPQQEILSFDEI